MATEDFSNEVEEGEVNECILFILYLFTNLFICSHSEFKILNP